MTIESVLRDFLRQPSCRGINLTEAFRTDTVIADPIPSVSS